MARVPYVNREDMDAEGQEIYDRIRNDRNSPTVGLQFRAMLHSPKAASHLTSMGAQLRFQSAMPENLKEFAIILVAREWSERYRVDRARGPRRQGRRERGVDRGGAHAEGAGGPHRGREDHRAASSCRCCGRRRCPDEAFAAAQKLLGTRGVVDLTLTCSYYTAICMAQVAFKPEMEPGKTSTL